MGLLYRQSIPVLQHKLENLSSILSKAEAYADERKMLHEYMLNFRLVHDMRGLIYQVQSCCNTAKFLAVRLGTVEDKYFPDDETSFDQLQGRIQSTIEFLQTVDEQAMDGAEDKPVLMEIRAMGNYKFSSGSSYAADFAMPYFYFHLSSAYCILRHLGVPLSAFDYVGADVFVKAG